MTPPSPTDGARSPITAVADQHRTAAAGVRDALRSVIDPCCRDRGVSVIDMGLLHSVSVDEDGHADVEVLLTSGWCPFQVDLVAEIAAAATAVPGVTDADVHITLQHVWSPQRMSTSARSKLRLLPDPGQAGDRDRYLAANPRPIAPQEVANDQ